jgi:hypothetical protein
MSGGDAAGPQVPPAEDWGTSPWTQDGDPGGAGIAVLS